MGNKKGAMELSMGTIVILVLAMTMLILGLVLFKSILNPTGEFVIKEEKECWDDDVKGIETCESIVYVWEINVSKFELYREDWFSKENKSDYRCDCSEEEEYYSCGNCYFKEIDYKWESYYMKFNSLKGEIECYLKFTYPRSENITKEYFLNKLESPQTTIRITNGCSNTDIEFYVEYDYPRHCGPSDFNWCEVINEN